MPPSARRPRPAARSAGHLAVPPKPRGRLFAASPTRTAAGRGPRPGALGTLGLLVCVPPEDLITSESSADISRPKRPGQRRTQPFRSHQSLTPSASSSGRAGLQEQGSFRRRAELGGRTGYFRPSRAHPRRNFLTNALRHAPGRTVASCSGARRWRDKGGACAFEVPGSGAGGPRLALESFPKSSSTAASDRGPVPLGDFRPRHQGGPRHPPGGPPRSGQGSSSGRVAAGARRRPPAPGHPARPQGRTGRRRRTAPGGCSPARTTKTASSPAMG